MSGSFLKIHIRWEFDVPKLGDNWNPACHKLIFYLREPTFLVMEAFAKSLTELANKVPASEMNLNLITIHATDFDIKDKDQQSRAIISVIEAIGKLRTQCNLAVNFLSLIDTDSRIRFGNITGLFIIRYDGTGIFEKKPGHLLPQLVKGSRIVRLGYYSCGKFKYGIDRVGLAAEIRKDKTRTDHKTKSKWPQIATAMRTQQDLVRAYYSACVQLVHICRASNIPGDVMRYIANLMNPQDWAAENSKRVLTRMKPGWAEKIIKTYKKVQEQVSQYDVIDSELKVLEASYKRAQREVIDLPKMILATNKKSAEALEEYTKLKKSLEDACNDIDYDQYGRLGNSKRFKTKK